MMTEIIIYHAHDYPKDSKLTYTNDGKRGEIELQFTSEDPDMGTETLVYGGNDRFLNLVEELCSEITSHLDNGTNAEIYDEYSRTALYAWESMLIDIKEEVGLCG